MAKKRQNTKEIILNVAKEQIIAHGYTAASIDKILAQIGITKGTFFYHFKSKEALAIELVKKETAAHTGLLSRLLSEARMKTTDPLQQFLSFIDLIAETYDNKHPYTNIILIINREIGKETLEIRQLCQATFNEWHHILETPLKTIWETYTTPAFVTPSLLADQFLVLFEGSASLSHARQTPALTSALLQQFKHLVEFLFLHNHPVPVNKPQFPGR